MNISNYLTILRIIISFFCMGFILYNRLGSLIIALILFLLASFTDFLDGYLARKKNIVSDLGKLLDPIADKVLVIGIFLAFLELRIISVWMVIVIMLREFLITGIRIFNLNRGFVLEAKMFGKHKTVSQIAAIIFILVMMILKHLYPKSSKISGIYNVGIPIVMWYVIVITLFSGLYYLWINRKIIKSY